MHAQSLEEQLESTARLFGYRIVYSPGAVPDTSFSLSAKPSSTLEEALKPLTGPFNLEYTVIGKQVVVNRRRERSFSTYGFVEDATTGERLVGATVVLLRSGRGLITNGYGHFASSGIRNGELAVISYVGYPADTIQLLRDQRGPVRVRLRPALQLNTVEVTASPVSLPVLPPTDRPLTPRVLDDLELVVGDRDINLWLGRQTGITSRAGGFGGYSVRGADPNQNLVLLDDAALYLPSHAAGFASSIMGDAVRSLQFFKNAGDARFGDRVGGVIDIRLKEGSRTKRSTMLSVGVRDVRAAAEGPLGRGSFYLAGRRGLTDLWLRLLRPSVRPAEASIPDINFLFYDFTGKINLPLPKRQRIYVSVFTGRDRYDDADEIFLIDGRNTDGFLDQSNRSWLNAVGSVRHNVAIGSRWFVNTTATLSQFTSSATDEFVLTENRDSEEALITTSSSFFATSLLDLGLKQDFDFAWQPGVALSFGIDAVAHRFRVGTNTAVFDRVIPSDSLAELTTRVKANQLPQLRTYDASAYASVQIKRGSRWEVDLGARLSSQLGGEEPYLALLPRLRGVYTISERLAATASAGLARQYIHNITTPNPGLSRELWVPSVAGLKPQRSRYATLGLRYSAGKDHSAAVTVHANQLGGLARFTTDFASLSLSEWVDNLRAGSGTAYGVEAEASSIIGSWRFEFGYTYMRASRQYEDQLGQPQVAERFELDRRHSGRLSANWSIGEQWSVGANFQVGTGLPARLPRRNLVAPDIPDTNVPLTNSWRYVPSQVQLKPFHTLDIGARRIYLIENIEHKLSFGVQNVYLRQNALFLNLRLNESPEAGTPSYRLTQITTLPFLPFARYSIRF